MISLVIPIYNEEDLVDTKPDKTFPKVGEQSEYRHYKTAQSQKAAQGKERGKWRLRASYALAHATRGEAGIALFANTHARAHGGNQ